METDFRRNAEIFKAFCDENRLKILGLLRGGEKCACKLLEEMGIGQSTLSHHMRILCASGVVVGRREGKWVHYSISEEGRERVKDLIEQVTGRAPKGGKAPVEESRP